MADSGHNRELGQVQADLQHIKEALAALREEFGELRKQLNPSMLNLASLKASMRIYTKLVWALLIGLLLTFIRTFFS